VESFDVLIVGSGAAGLTLALRLPATTRIGVLSKDQLAEGSSLYAPFSREHLGDGSEPLHLHREGGHSHRRIVHAADATGRAIETTLEDRVRASDNITVLEHHLAVDLSTHHHLDSETAQCHGA